MLYKKKKGAVVDDLTDLDLSVVDPLSYDDWDDMVSVFTDASFFHSRAWITVLKRSYGYQPISLVGKCDGNPVVVLPLMGIKSHLTGCRGVSLPFSDYCPPLVSAETNKAVVEEYISSLGKENGWKYLEIRGEGLFSNEATPLTTYLLHTLDLSSDPQELFAQFRKGTKSTIKKAQKEKVEIMADNSWASMIEFYRLNCLTRKMHGVPPQPLSFFKELHTWAIDPEMGLIVLAHLNGKCIGAGIFLEFGGNVIYKYGASDKQYSAIGANNLILWHAIKHYSGRDCSTLCFGRTSTENKGLTRFKSGWGTRESTVNYHRKDLTTDSFTSQEPETSSLLNRAFSHLPISVSRQIGRLLYRHLG